MNQQARTRHFLNSLCTLCTLCSLLLTFLSCEPPPRRRFGLNASDRDRSKRSQTDNSRGINFNDGPNSPHDRQRNGEYGPNRQQSGGLLLVGADFAHCSLRKDIYLDNDPILGEFNICQGQRDPSKVLLQVQRGLGQYRLCLFPTSKEKVEGSVMIGSASCLLPRPGFPEVVRLQINREGFKQKKLTGIMFVIDKPYGEVTPYDSNLTANSPTFSNAYEHCMLYLYRTGDTLACERFKSKGQYVSRSFQ